MAGGTLNSPDLVNCETNSINLSSGTIIQTSPLAVNTQLKTNVINPLTNPSIVMGNTDINGTLKTNTLTPYSGTVITATSTLACSSRLNTNIIQPLSGTGISINADLSFVQNIPVLSSPNGLRIRVFHLRIEQHLKKHNHLKMMSPVQYYIFQL